MSQLSSSHLMKPLAILIDGKVIAAPRLRSTISKQAQIAGGFKQAEAERIVAGIAAAVQAAGK